MRQISTGNHTDAALSFDHIGVKGPEMQKFCHFLVQENYEQLGDQTGGVLEGNVLQEKNRGSKQQHTSGRYPVSTFCRD